MIAFWIAAAVLAGAASLFMLWSASRARAETPAASPEAALYARHLADVEQMRDRGLLGEEEHRAARAETGRRLLAAVDARGAPVAATAFGRRAVLVAALLVPLVAGGVYLLTGRPGTADQPYAQRLETWRRTPLERLPPPALAALAEEAVKRRPEDPDGWRALGKAHLLAGDGPEAIRALEQAARLGDTAEDWVRLGETLAVRNGGAPDAAAAAAFRRALERDPASVPARYGLAQAAAAAGDRSGAAVQLRALAASLRAGDPRRAPLEAAAAQAAEAP